MDVGTLYHRSVECFADRVNDVGSDQWQGPIPCPGWTVRDRTGTGGTVQVSFGETRKAEYAMQLAADHLEHGGDLAVSTAPTPGWTRTWCGGRRLVRRPRGAVPRRRRDLDSPTAHRRPAARPPRPVRT
jgi:hypothetical protein